MYARLYIAHTYTKFLNNYKNCAVPSVIVVSVRVNDGDFPSLSHPQHNSVHSWRLFTPRESERRRHLRESNAAKHACDC